MKSVLEALLSNDRSDTESGAEPDEYEAEAEAVEGAIELR